MTSGLNGRWLLLALLATLATALGAWLDIRFGWLSTAFDAIAHLFFEVPLVAAVRRPSQLVLIRWHLAIGSTLLACALWAAPWLNRHSRNFVAILILAYVIRAAVWICGGNLPLVPGDSCHYLEVATSVLRGEGPVKHYVESFFRDYTPILEGKGVLDDWATPLDAYVRAATFRLAGLGPDSPLAARIAAAKACSFVINLLCLPALYVFARRRYGCRVAIWTMAALAVLPVHAIYAGFVLRESLVALFSILAVWTLSEMLATDPGRRRAIWAWAAAAGVCGGLAILSRTTAAAILAASGLFALVFHGRRRLGPLILWGAAAVLVCTPWAWATLNEYGAPFYSYTNYFEYNFSWTIHHYEKGNTLASQFYTLENMPEIVRVKIKSLILIVVSSTMIVGLPVMAGFCAHLVRRKGRERETDLLVAVIGVVFVVATLKSIADVTQVAQLGRYYLPLFALMLPGGIAGLIDALAAPGARKLVPWTIATYCALVWADPTWAYDASWLNKRFQLHWPALAEAGEWIQTHTDRVSPNARIMTWFPWELRVTSDRITVLMPRNFDPRRIREVIDKYGVTHVLWGSFEPPPYFEINPESWSTELEKLRSALGFTNEREVYRTSRDIFFPLRLYRVR